MENDLFSPLQQKDPFDANRNLQRKEMCDQTFTSSLGDARNFGAMYEGETYAFPNAFSDKLSR